MANMFFEKFTNSIYVRFSGTLFLIVILIGCQSNVDEVDEAKEKYESAIGTNQIPKVRIGDAIFQVELAINPSERAKGLSGKDILEENNGMLFIFDENAATQFWMYGMKFPLDLVWISSSCEIIDITHKAKNPENPNTSDGLVLYSSKAPATYTLEINAGEVDLHGINIGEFFLDILPFGKITKKVELFRVFCHLGKIPPSCAPRVMHRTGLSDF